MFALARRNNVKLPYASVEAVRQAYQLRQFAGLSRHLLPRHVGVDRRAGFLRSRLRLSATRARRQCPACRDVLRPAGTHRARHRFRHGDRRALARNRRCESAARPRGEPDYVLSPPSRRSRCRADAGFGAYLPRQDRRRRARFIRARPSAEQIRPRVCACARRRLVRHRACRRGRAAELCLGGARHPRRRPRRSRQPLARRRRAGRPVGARAHGADRLSAVQSATTGRRRPCAPSAAADAGQGPRRHRQFRRPGVFRRLCERELLRRVGRAAR